jgi:hypothetical protein
MDADVAALPDGGRLPREPWQKRDIGGLRRLGAQRGSRALHRERRGGRRHHRRDEEVVTVSSAKVFRKASK